MEALHPLALLLIVAALLLLVIFGAVASLGVIAALAPPLHDWLNEQIERLLKRR
ncbi:MAG TPA: hypothetical protein PKD53_19900 [Chloroflexaceae bacterium]|nr:hypothetical protein [Chloroflexaceae bacterium]